MGPWWMPWVTASEIAAFLSTPYHVVGTSQVLKALKSARKRGWVMSETLGRVEDAETRWVYVEDGVAWGEAQGWRRYWWHNNRGVRALARRLQLVERVYGIMVDLPRSNLVVSGRTYVLRSSEQIHERTREPVSRWNLHEADWSSARLFDFMWVKDKPFDAVLGFSFGGGVAADGTRLEPDRLYIPVMSMGRFDKFEKVAWARNEMEKVLGRRDEWGRLPLDQSSGGAYRPVLVVVCSD